ncbi:hypothetical protein C942_00503 [Photobacterium marinum]|uniref:Phage protein n=1 Tax=Photobacterium marinum TaxID=1056511 RepID=L8JB74_9GAMM|nr:hypothetical protein [Photobacterium marinum]ELR66061.1 hypothetical protein C942_00503 [Photobacterium marinum]
MALSKQAILAADDLPTESVHVPAWGGDVMVKGLSVGEMAKAQRKANKGTQLDLMVYVMIYGCVDENGKHLFTEKDVKALLTKNQEPIVEVTNKIFELSGFGLTPEEEKEEAGN